MSEQNEFLNDNQKMAEATRNEELSPNKKPFVEPELSSAVDVLEATTFFQGVTSGTSN